MKKTVKFTVGDFKCKAFVKKSATGKLRHLEIIWAPAPPNRPLTEKEDRDYQRGLMLAMTANSDKTAPNRFWGVYATAWSSTDQIYP